MIENRWNRFLVIVGIGGRILTYGLIIYALTWLKPAEISNVPLSNLTLSEIWGWVMWLGAIFGLLYWLFHPDDFDETREAWGKFTLVAVPILLVGLVVLFIAYPYPRIQ